MGLRANMDRFFKISARGTSVGTEVLGGITTFFTMAYIVIVNPAILVAAGIPYSAALTATCLGAAIATAAMGLIANRPIALASGMGINAMVAYTVCLGCGVDWRVGMACVFAEGVVILVLVICGLREAVMRAIPPSLRISIGIGIGLFIALMGFINGGLVVDDESTLISFGNVTAPTAIVGLVSLLLAIAFQARKVTGGLLWSIVIAAIVGVPLGVTVLPESWNFGLDFSSFAAPFQKTPDGAIAIVQVFTKPILLAFVFSLLMTDFFDTMGSVLAMAQQAGFANDEDGFEDARTILLVDSSSAILGGFLSSSSLTVFVESTAGIGAGARTGLHNIVVAIFFVICAFFAPVFGMIPTAATSGALVVVGFLMMSNITEIEWKKIEYVLPAFLIIVGIPLFYSITDGIGLGFIAHCIIMVLLGRAREVHPLMWIVSAAFVAVFITSSLL